MVPPRRRRAAPTAGTMAGAACSGGMAARSRSAPVGWGRILANTWSELGRDNVSVMAAGVAFFAFLSLFPAMSALISLYGLVADPKIIERQLNSLSYMLPKEALTLVSGQLHALIAAPSGALGIGFLVSLLLALWSATSGVSTLMQALTVAYEERERRGILAFYAEAIVLTIGIGAFGVVSLFLIAVVPAILDLLPIELGWAGAALFTWPVLAALTFVALALVYRFAPARRVPRWHWLRAGTIGAAVLWLLASAGFSFYVSRFASYDKTYGSLGAVAVLMIWFYLGAYITLAGAELNSEIDRGNLPSG